MTAGSPHTLYCTMMEVPYLTVLPSLQLIAPGGGALVSDNSSFTVSHTLRRVTKSHAGQYTCIGSVDVSSVNVSVEDQSSSNLTVESKYGQYTA